MGSTATTTTLESFMQAVEEGLNLSKRIYFGKDRSIAPPKQAPPMSKSPNYYLPTSPMVYGVVNDPSFVDNPDIPSYQPYVYGRCDPPALIPLQMCGVKLEVSCYYEESVFVCLHGQWRVHCVMGSKACDCRLAVPMGPLGSILGVEVDLPRKSYHTQLVAADDKMQGSSSVVDEEKFLRPDIFFLTIPEVSGGTNLSIKISWSQKLSYHDGEFSLFIPFCFPEYVTPPSKKVPKREKILLNVHPGYGREVMCKSVSHPLKEQTRQSDFLSFVYEADVLTWSNQDFSFSYSVPASHIYGSVFLQSPSVDDLDQREMFCLQILPANQQRRKVFSKTIVYVVDISGSMEGKPLEATKTSLGQALSKLGPEDMFNIIAFSEDTFPFSLEMKPANQETIEKATQWMDSTFHVGCGTNISLALDKAMSMLSDTFNSLPMIFLITDGAVEDERHICNIVKDRLTNMKQICPRVHTFGIGLYCNHYFLRMLAMIGRGHYDAAYEAESIESHLQKLFTKASSTELANITFDTLNDLEHVEVHPMMSIPDLSSESTLIVTGRYRGNFPEVLKARGISSDMTSYELDLMVHEAKAIPLENMLAMEQIIINTAQAWLWEDKQLERKVVDLSIRNGIISEYTYMGLFMTETLKKEAEIGNKKRTSRKMQAAKTEPTPQKVKVLRNIGIGFGDIKATIENFPSGSHQPRAPEAAEKVIKAASDCCTRICGYCCCMCCIQACSKINNQCAIVCTQLFTALACSVCIDWCTEND